MSSLNRKRGQGTNPEKRKGEYPLTTKSGRDTAGFSESAGMGMRKKKRMKIAAVLCMTAVFCLAGCGGNQKEGDPAETEIQAAADNGTENTKDNESGDEEYVIEYNVDDYVVLGDYTGFLVDKVKTEVTDEDIDMEVESFLDEYSELVEITDGASEDDYINFDCQVSIDGEVDEDLSGNMDIMLGMEEMGKKIDKALKGAKADDQVTVKMTLDDTYGQGYVGEKAVFDITVNVVYQYVAPELDQEFVEANTDCQTVEEFREQIRQELYQEYENYNLSEAQSSAISMAVDQAEISGYPEELFESSYNRWDETYGYYADMFGMERSEMISDEDLEAVALNDVYVSMIVRAIMEKENLTLTEEDFEAYLEKNLAEYDCSSTDELLESYGENDLRRNALQSMVGQFILDRSQINEMSQEEYDEIYNQVFEEE
ncbi:MAG: hypothetical protein PUB22_10260 [Clostridiales bacterium]|nr:hypothetical protein [Clostridiales bacterium]